MSNNDALIQHVRDDYKEALFHAHSAYTRGTIAMKENRWLDAERELIYCRRFMQVINLFQSHMKIYNEGRTL